MEQINTCVVVLATTSAARKAAGRHKISHSERKNESNWVRFKFRKQVSIHGILQLACVDILSKLVEDTQDHDGCSIISWGRHSAPFLLAVSLNCRIKSTCDDSVKKLLSNPESVQKGSFSRNTVFDQITQNTKRKLERDSPNPFV